MGVTWRRRVGYSLLVLLTGMVLLLAGCGAESNNSAAYSGAADNASFQMSSGDGSEQASAGHAVTAAADADSANSGSSGLGTGLSEDEANLAINRKLIYRADVTIEVEDYGVAQSEIRNLIQLSGGYLIEFSESKTEYENGGTFVIKVPSSGFMSFLNRLEELSPEHYESHVTGQDVTEEYIDLEARLKAQQVIEQRLLTFMEQATRADDLVEFSRELGSVQQEIERIKGRLRYLEQHVAYSTIEVRVYELTEGVSRIQNKNAPFGERLTGSLKAVLSGISIVLQELVIFIVAAIPVVIVLGAIASPFYFWYRHRMRHPQQYRGSGGMAPSHANIQSPPQASDEGKPDERLAETGQPGVHRDVREEDEARKVDDDDTNKSADHQKPGDEPDRSDK